MAEMSEFYTPPQDMQDIARDYAKMRNYAVMRGLAGARDAQAGRDPRAGVSRLYRDPNTITEFDRREKIDMMAKLATLETQLKSYNSASARGRKSMAGSIQRSMADLMETAVKEQASSSRTTATVRSAAAQKEMERAEKAIEEASKNLISWRDVGSVEGAEALIGTILSTLSDPSASTSEAWDALAGKEDAEIMAILTESARRGGKTFEELSKGLLSGFKEGDHRRMKFELVLENTESTWSALLRANDSWVVANEKSKVGAGLGGASPFVNELQTLWTNYLSLINAGETVPDHMIEALKGMGFQVAESEKEKAAAKAANEDPDLVDKTLAELEKGPTEPVLLRLKKQIVEDDRFIQYMSVRGYTNIDYAFKKFMQESRQQHKQGVNRDRKAALTNRLSGATQEGLLGDVSRLLAGKNRRESAEEEISARYARNEEEEEEKAADEETSRRGEDASEALPLDESREEGAAYGSDDDEYAEDAAQYPVPEVTRTSVPGGEPPIDLELHDSSATAAVSEPPNLSGAADEPAEDSGQSVLKSVKEALGRVRQDKSHLKRPGE